MNFWSSNWKATVRTVVGDTDKVVYDVGRYDVEVDFSKTGEDRENAVRYGKKRHDARQVPDIDVDVDDGQIKIDLEDLLGLAINKLEPAEIARHLWKEKEVRNEFVRMLVDAYGSNEWSTGSSFEFDDSREEVLDKLNVQLFHRRLDRAANVLRSAEYYERKYWELYHATAWARGGSDPVARPDFLPEFTVGKDEYGNISHVSVQEDPEHKIGSKNWNEARDHWRHRILSLVGDPKDTIEN
jgi:hypothetical protein